MTAWRMGMVKCNDLITGSFGIALCKFPVGCSLIAAFLIRQRFFNPIALEIYLLCVKALDCEYNPG